MWTYQWFAENVILETGLKAELKRVWKAQDFEALTLRKKLGRDKWPNALCWRETRQQYWTTLSRYQWQTAGLSSTTDAFKQTYLDANETNKQVAWKHVMHTRSVYTDMSWSTVYWILNRHTWDKVFVSSSQGRDQHCDNLFSDRKWSVWGLFLSPWLHWRSFPWEWFISASVLNPSRVCNSALTFIIISIAAHENSTHSATSTQKFLPGF